MELNVKPTPDDEAYFIPSTHDMDVQITGPIIGFKIIK